MLYQHFFHTPHLEYPGVEYERSADTTYWFNLSVQLPSGPPVSGNTLASIWGEKRLTSSDWSGDLFVIVELDNVIPIDDPRLTAILDKHEEELARVFTMEGQERERQLIQTAEEEMAIEIFGDLANLASPEREGVEMVKRTLGR